MKKVLALILVCASLGYGQSVSTFRVSGSTVVQATADSTIFLNKIRNTLAQHFDSIAIPPTPPAGVMYLFGQGSLGIFVKYPDGSVRNLDSAAAGGGALAWTDTVSVLATQYDLSLVSGADSTTWIATDYDVSLKLNSSDTTSLSDRINLKAPLASPTFTGLATFVDSQIAIKTPNGLKTDYVRTQNTVGTVHTLPASSGTLLHAPDTVSTLGTKYDLTLKLNSTDTVSLSNRINLKADTVNQTFTGTTTTTTVKLDTLKPNTPTGTLIFQGGNGAVATSSDSAGVAVDFRNSDGKSFLKIISDSSRVGLKGGDDKPANSGNSPSHVGILDPLWVEDDIWADEAITLTSVVPRNGRINTTIADSAPRWQYKIRVASASNFYKDANIEIGSPEDSDYEVHRIVSISSDTIRVADHLSYPHSAGTTITGYRAHGSIHPGYYSPWKVGGVMRIGAPATPGEVDTWTPQAIEYGSHAMYASHLGKYGSSTVIYGGRVDTTSPASMGVDVDSGMGLVQKVSIDLMPEAYTFESTTQNSVTIAAADNDSNRIDVIYWDSSGVVRVAQGTNAITPTAPSTPTSGIKLAQVAVDSDMTSIPLTAITDYRDTKYSITPQTSRTPQGTVEGLSVSFTATPVVTSTANYRNSITTTASGNVDVTNVRGLAVTLNGNNTDSITTAIVEQSQLNNNAAGYIGTARGVQGSISNLSTGTIGTAQGLYTQITNSNASGTITDAYGLYIANWTRTGTITNGWGIYEQDTAWNYLGGRLGLGAVNPYYTLSAAATGSAVGFNFTASNINTTRSSAAQESDTSAITGSFTATGKPLLSLKGIAGNGVLTVDSSGRLGIGTSTPTAILSLSGEVVDTIRGERNSTGAGKNMVIEPSGALAGGTNLAGGSLFLLSGKSTGNGGSSIIFATNGSNGAGTTDRVSSEIMRVSSNSNIGIGTASPRHKLTIEGATTVPAINLVHTTFNTTRANAAGAIDTSSASITFTATGKPVYAMTGPVGDNFFKVDSAAAVTGPASLTFSGLSPSVTGGRIGWDSTNRRFLATSYLVQRSLDMTHSVRVADEIDSSARDGVAEFAIDSIPMAANFPSAGKIVQIKIFGTYTTTANQSFTLVFRHGATGEVLDSVQRVATNPGHTEAPFEATFTGTFRTTGSSGTMVGHTSMISNGTPQASTPQGEVTVNTTSHNTIYCYVRMSSAAATNKITIRQFWAETKN